MMELLTIASKVSPTFWGIVVGSLFTIIGVVITNASNIKRLRIQQDYEREMKAREYDLGLRKEVYLQAMEAISTGMTAIGRFGELNIPHQELMRAYMDRSHAIAKVSIIGHKETIEAMVDFNQALIGAFVHLSSRRENVDLLQKQLSDIEQQAANANQEFDQLMSRLRENEVTGQLNSAQIEMLNGHVEQVKYRQSTLHQSEEELSNQLMPEIMQLVAQSIKELAPLDNKLAKVIGLIRNELDLPFDEEHYLKIMNAGHEKMMAYLKEITSDISDA